MIAPLAALEPYKAEAAAPFKTFILSISFELSSLIPALPVCEPAPEPIGIPSITNNGEEGPELNALSPRIEIRLPPPTTAPELIFKPATFPLSMLTRLLFGLSKASDFICWVA